MLQAKDSFYLEEGIADLLKIGGVVCKHHFLSSQRQKLADTPRIPDLGDQHMFFLEDISLADRSSPEVSVLEAFKLSPLLRNQNSESLVRKYLDD